MPLPIAGAPHASDAELARLAALHRDDGADLVLVATRLPLEDGRLARFSLPARWWGRSRPPAVIATSFGLEDNCADEQMRLEKALLANALLEAVSARYAMRGGDVARLWADRPDGSVFSRCTDGAGRRNLFHCRDLGDRARAALREAGFSEQELGALQADMDRLSFGRRDRLRAALHRAEPYGLFGAGVAAGPVVQYLFS